MPGPSEARILTDIGVVARLLALNHVYLSVGSVLFRSASSSLLRKAPTEIPPRIVVVVGAGASNAACGLPTGTEASNLLRSKPARVSASLVDEEIRRITVEYRLGAEDFETVLLALSKFDQAMVLKELGAMFNRRHYPSLGYELLAHWMKHRFVDAVVNFNFDETLDQAIDDEMGGIGYHKVVSDGDCPDSPNEWIDPARNRFRFPLYLKPHGTASHKSTLRFTRNSYSLLPPELRSLLTRLFDDEAVVIVVGHAMQSVEFNDILRSRRRLRFVFIDRKCPALQPLEPNDAASRRKDHIFLPVGKQIKLGDRLRAVTEAVSDEFENSSRPRGIERHKLISTLFAATADQDRDPVDEANRVKNYLRDRIYVEISLAVAKAKGFLSVDHLTRGRVGRYFRLYRKMSGARESILDFCDQLELEQFGYARDTVYLPARSASGDQERFSRPTLDETAFNDVVGVLADNTTQCLSPHLQARLSADRSQLIETLDKMYGGDEVEVSVDLNGASEEVFTAPRLLPTLTAMRLETRRMLEKHRWDALLCTAESGQWLREEWVRNRILDNHARLAIVVADRTEEPDLVGDFAALGARIRWLPWWLHNRHVTVILKDRCPTHAIYFERRLRTSHIVPLRLTGGDANLAMDAFVAYWTKAKIYEKARSDGEITEQRLETERSTLLDELYLPATNGGGARSRKTSPPR